MNELVESKKFELFSQSDIDMIREFDEVSKRYKVWKDSKQKQFESFLNEIAENSYTQDGITLLRTADYTKKQVDTKKMKEEGIYDLYTRDVKVKGSIKIQIDYD